MKTSFIVLVGTFYKVTIEKPEDTFITVANGYQLFWRNVADHSKFSRVPNDNWYPELAVDKEKLDSVKVLNIELVEPHPEKLFKVGNL